MRFEERYAICRQFRQSVSPSVSERARGCGELHRVERLSWQSVGKKSSAHPTAGDALPQPDTQIAAPRFLVFIRDAQRLLLISQVAGELGVAVRVAHAGAFGIVGITPI